jgi:hypothetical protein
LSGARPLFVNASVDRAASSAVADRGGEIVVAVGAVRLRVGADVAASRVAELVAALRDHG